MREVNSMYFSKKIRLASGISDKYVVLLDRKYAKLGKLTTFSLLIKIITELQTLCKRYIDIN